MNSILVVEDDAHVASLLHRSLAEEGYEVSVAQEGTTGLEMALANSFDLLLLDIMLPGISGLEICKQVRAKSIFTPILMLTALGTTQNIVTGLDSGADDYMVKPFKLAELTARIRTLIRRSNNSHEGNEVTVAGRLQIADMVLNEHDKTATRAGMKIDLTATEYRLLEYFLKNKKRLLSRMDILENVWGIDFNMNTKVVDVYVNYLRKKIDKDSDTKLLHTVVGMGYILKEDS